MGQKSNETEDENKLIYDGPFKAFITNSFSDLLCNSILIKQSYFFSPHLFHFLVFRLFCCFYNLR